MLKDIHHIRYRRLGFSVDEYFLTKDTQTAAGINYFIQCPLNVDNTLDAFYTLLIDLREPIEKIRQGIYHRTLSEINSFVNNQLFEHTILVDVSEQTLNEFIVLFDHFATQKNIRKAEKFRLKAYNKAGILAISYIKQSGRFLCVNFYRLTRERAANISSFTLNDLGLSSSQLGRAHRALHWLDIEGFKNMGAAYYDFCGWYAGQSDAHQLNINKFKEQFSQNKIKEYSGVIYKNKLLLLLLKLLR